MNIILITIDCLRRDRCGIYGHHRNTTPTIDTLGQNGTIFKQAYATGPVTTESFPGILAGRLSAHTVAGQNIYQKRLPKQAPTVASRLHDNGWETTAVISNPRIGEHTAIDRGFEKFKNLRNSGSVNTDGGLLSDIVPELSVGERLYQLRERMRSLNTLPLRYEIPFLGFRYYQQFTGWPSVSGRKVVDEFLKSLEDTETPFFAWTHLMDVHGPINPESIAQTNLEDTSTITQFRSQARRVSNVADVRTEARYDSAVRYVDTQVRRIVQHLKSNNQWDETSIIITSDHGEALCERGLYGHPQHYMYDELLSVPLVVRTPNERGGINEHPFSLGWIHEIIAELCSVQSLTAPLTSTYGEHLSEKELNASELDIITSDSIGPDGHSIAVRNLSDKYVTHTLQTAHSDELSVGPHGHFDTLHDPQERTPLDNTNSDLVREAQEIKTNVQNINTNGEVRDIDEEVADQLKQLGYS